MRDINPTVHRPYAVWAIIAVNALAFVAQVGLGSADEFVQSFGLIPQSITGGHLSASTAGAGSPPAWFTLFSSMFLHGGLAHVLGNLWFLHIFGDNVEDAMGPWRFAPFYVAAGVVASAAHIATDPESLVPTIGASGAISGVLGAYLYLYRHARIVTVVPLGFLLKYVEVPAWVFAALWFAMQLVLGALALGSTGGGVAWFAHVGGFTAGVALAPVFAPKHLVRARRGLPRRHEAM